MPFFIIKKMFPKISIIIVIVSIIAFIYGEYNTTSICLGILTSFVVFSSHHYFFYKCEAKLKKCIKNIVRHSFKLIGSFAKFKYFRSPADTNKSATSKHFTIFCIFIIYQYIPSMFDTAFSSRADFASRHEQSQKKF
jgi:hypothetical protein